MIPIMLLVLACFLFLIFEEEKPALRLLFAFLYSVWVVLLLIVIERYYGG